MDAINYLYIVFVVVVVVLCEENNENSGKKQNSFYCFLHIIMKRKNSAKETLFHIYSQFNIGNIKGVLVRVSLKFQKSIAPLFLSVSFCNLA